MRIFQATGGNFTLLILMFGVMFLFLILPQQRRAKRERKFKNELKKGDLIVTKGGIHGKVIDCLLYTSPSPRDGLLSRMPSSA